MQLFTLLTAWNSPGKTLPIVIKLQDKFPALERRVWGPWLQRVGSAALGCSWQPGASHHALSWDQQSLAHSSTVCLSFPMAEEVTTEHSDVWEWDKQMGSAHPTSSCTQHMSNNSNKTQANISWRMQPKEAEMFWDIEGIGLGYSILYVTQKALQDWNLKWQNNYFIIKIWRGIMPKSELIKVEFQWQKIAGLQKFLNIFWLCRRKQCFTWLKNYIGRGCPMPFCSPLDTFWFWTDAFDLQVLAHVPRLKIRQRGSLSTL